MFRFLETDIREQKKYEKRIQTSVDNTVNDLRYEIKFATRFFINLKLLFFLSKNIFYSCRHIFWRFLAFFCQGWYYAAVVKHTDWIIRISTTWLFIFWPEVANEKPLFKKPASNWLKFPIKKMQYFTVLELSVILTQTVERFDMSVTPSNFYNKAIKFISNRTFI